jgi:hypothetical protein
MTTTVAEIIIDAMRDELLRIDTGNGAPDVEINLVELAGNPSAASDYSIIIDPELPVPVEGDDRSPGGRDTYTMEVALYATYSGPQVGFPRYAPLVRIQSAITQRMRDRNGNVLHQLVRELTPGVPTIGVNGELPIARIPYTVVFETVIDDPYQQNEPTA